MTAQKWNCASPPKLPNSHLNGRRGLRLYRRQICYPLEGALRPYFCIRI
jgi:hypothetical protein